MEATVQEVFSANGAPEGSDATISAAEDSFRLLAGADFGFVDPDGAASLFGVIITGTTGGTLYYDADGAAGGGLPVAVGNLPRTYTVDEMANGNLSWRADPDVNGSGVGSITFQVVDDSGAVDDSANRLTIDVTPVNDAPALTSATDFVLAFVEDGGPIPLMQGVVMSDPDAPPHFAGGGLTLEVSITPDTPGDVISAGEGGISLRPSASFVVNDLGGGSFGIFHLDGTTETAFGTIAGYGTLAVVITGLTAFATQARLNDLIDDFVYDNPSDTPPETTGGSVTLTVNDGDSGGGALASMQQVLLLAAADDPAVAQDDSFTIEEAQSLVLGGNVFEDNGFGVDFDPDGAGLSIAAVNGSSSNVGAAFTLASGAVVMLDSLGTLTYTGEDIVGTDSFTYTLTGGDSATVTIEIVAVNDAPFFQLSDTELTATLDYVEGDGASAIIPTALVSDADSDFGGGSLTVSIQNNGTADDQLGVRNLGTEAGQIGISGSDISFAGTTIGSFSGGGNGSALIVSFNANASVAAAQALVRNITYANSSDDPSTVSRSINFLLNDGDGGVSAAQANAVVNVTAIDDAPRGTDATIGAAEDSFRLLAGDDFGFVDPDGAAVLGGVIISATTGGTLYYDADGAAGGGVPVAVEALPRTFTVAEMNLGNLSWRAGSDVNGSGIGSITFKVIDDGGAVSAADNVITIDVAAVNDAPALTSPSDTDVVFVENSEPVPMLQGVTLSDPDAPADFAGGSLTLKLPPGNGGLILRSGSNFVVNDLGDGTFALAWRDGATELPFGAIAGYGTRDLAITGLTGFATLERLNDLIDDFAYANESDTPSIDLIDYSLDQLSVTFSDGGNIGGGALTAIQTQQLTIWPTDDPAVAQDDFLQGRTLITSLFQDNGSGADFDPEGNHFSIIALNGQAVSQSGAHSILLPSGASATVYTNGALEYFAFPDSFGTDSFTYTLSGGDSATVTIDLDPSYQSPSGQDKSVTIDEDGTFTFAVADFGFADADGDAFAGIVISTLATNGTLLLNGAAVAPGSFVTADQIAAGGFAFVPGADAFGTGHAIFTFRVRDDSGSAAGDTDLTVNAFTIDVRPVNDAPVLANLEGDTSSFTEGDLLVLLDTGTALALNDADSTDYEGGSLTVSIVANGVPGEDILAFSPFGSVSIAGSAVTVAGTPIGTISSNGTNGDPLVVDFNAFATPALVQVLISALAYANSNVRDPVTTQRQISITLTDGDGTANGGDDMLVVTSYVGVEPVNDAPSGTDGSATIDEDMPYTFAAADFGFSDVDGNAFAGVTITALATDGTLRLAGLAVTAGDFVTAADIAANLLTFEPDADGNGSHYATFAFQVRDDGGTDSGGIDTDPNADTFTLDVAAINDAPALTDLAGDTSSFTEGDLLVLLDTGTALALNDADSADYEGGSLTVAIAANGVPGEDILAFSPFGSVSVAGSAVTVAGTPIGTISGNGTNGDPLAVDFNAFATPARVQVLISALAYANSNVLDPATTQRQISIALADGDGTANGGADSVLVNLSTTITAVEDPAVAQPDAFTLAEDQVAIGSLFADNGSGADFDLDGPALAVAEVNGQAGNVGASFALASGASLRVNADGSYVYDPNGRFDYLLPAGSGLSPSSATDSFTYRLVNGGSATVTVTIEAVDDGDLQFGTAGNDTLSGGLGKDRVVGGAGHDNLSGGSGNDRLYGDDGNDLLDGGSGRDQIDGGKGDDTLVGGDGTDSLDGGKDADSMAGGADNDSYRVDNVGDIVIELAGGGKDSVLSTISYTLPASVERLFLLGGGDLSGRGNSSDNQIVGNSGDNYLSGYSGDDRIEGGAGDDTLIGGSGLDTLIGGAGRDEFVFSTTPAKSNTGRIYDYSAGEDRIVLDQDVFTQISKGALDADAFHLGTSAGDADDRILYDGATGNIFYDVDGIGSVAAILFAAVGPGTPLTHADFLVG